MPFRLALVLVLLFGVLVAYLASFNSTGVRVAVGRDWTYELPLIAVVVGAFLGGAAFAFVVGTLRDLGRSYRAHRRTRERRRADALHQVYQQGVEAELARRPAEATAAYEEVLRREPSHHGALTRLAELARQRGDWQAALEHDLKTLGADERVDMLLAVADDYRRLGRLDEARDVYGRVLARDRDHVAALRGIRDVLADQGRWADAIPTQERLVRLAAAASDRVTEDTWLAALYYEVGRAHLAEGNAHAAVARFKEAVRVRPDFLPATLGLGDAELRLGDSREALRTWERGLEAVPALPLLTRIEQVHHAEGRPARMIALYEAAAARHPDDLAISLALGRVYFELAMLDEAAEHFEKLEVRATELPAVHAYLAAIFERRGQIHDACEEYRRALRFPEAFEWPHHCAACGASRPSWFDRCPSCRRWNTSRP